MKRPTYLLSTRCPKKGTDLFGTGHEIELDLPGFEVQSYLGPMSLRNIIMK